MVGDSTNSGNKIKGKIMVNRLLWVAVMTMGMAGCTESTSQPEGDEALYPAEVQGEGGLSGESPGSSMRPMGSGDTVGGEDTANVIEPPAGCSGNDDCADGEVCDCAKACVPSGLLECVEDKNCGSGNYCDGCTGMCYPLKELCAPCGVDGECEGTGSKCLSLLSGAQVCGLACLNDYGCPKGYSCEEIPGLNNDQCVPSTGDCDAPVDCVEDSDCPALLICSEDNLCVQGCPDDDSCPQGKVCEGGRCIGACDEDGGSPCPEDKICVDGHCTVEGGCITSADCPESETYCDLEKDLCVPGCQVDADCKSAGLKCDSGSCVTKGCTANFFCGFGEVCNLGSGVCEIPPEPHCETCSPDSDTTCNVSGNGNQCLTFADEEGNEKGSFCLVSCGEDPQNPCPQGYSCEEVEVEEGVTTPLCVRDCSVPPV